jgi:hypothetical protein
MGSQPGVRHRLDRTVLYATPSHTRRKKFIYIYVLIRIETPNDFFNFANEKAY